MRLPHQASAQCIADICLYRLQHIVTSLDVTAFAYTLPIALTGDSIFAYTLPVALTGVGLLLSKTLVTSKKFSKTFFFAWPESERHICRPSQSIRP